MNSAEISHNKIFIYKLNRAISIFQELQNAFLPKQKLHYKSVNVHVDLHYNPHAKVTVYIEL